MVRSRSIVLSVAASSLGHCYFGSQAKAAFTSTLSQFRGKNRRFGRSGVLAGALVVGSLAPSVAQASPALITSFYSTASYGSAYRRTDTAGTDTPIDQQVTITSPVSVSSLDLYVGNTGAPVAESNVTVSIYSDSAGHVGSLIDTAVNPASAFSLTDFPLTTFTFPDDPTLSPGNYWVQLSDSSTSPIRWLQQNVLTDTSTSPGGFGTINDDVYYLGAYYNSPGTATSKDFILNINGTAAAVPEPASLSVLCIGTAALLGRRRRVDR